MKKWMSFVTVVALVSMVAWGCGGPEMPVSPNKVEKKEEEAHGHDHDQGSETTHVSYCGDCGFAKGSSDCCADGAEKCSKCNMTAGSTLCCKLEGDFAGKVLCGDCGEVGKSENCCKAGAESCAKCNLHTGSPLCCKLGESEG